MAQIKKINTHPAFEFANSVIRMNPQCVEHSASARANPPIEFHESCYLPTIAFSAMYKSTHSIPSINDEDFLAKQFQMYHEINALSASVAWRMTKGIYRFDADFLHALVTTDLKKIPAETLLRLPEWCVYVEHGIRFFYGDYDGFFAFVNHDPHENRFSMCFVFLNGSKLDSNNQQKYIALEFDLRATISECILSVIDRVVKTDPDKQRADNIALHTVQIVNELKPAVQQCFSILLYLCSEQPDITNAKNPESKPANPTVVPKLGKIIAASQPTTWEVGLRIGASLRVGGLIDNDADDTQTESRESQGKMRPHIRRAHWHTFWAGQDRTECRVKWMQPILVATKNTESIPVTIHT